MSELTYSNYEHQKNHYLIAVPSFSSKSSASLSSKSSSSSFFRSSINTIIPISGYEDDYSAMNQVSPQLDTSNKVIHKGSKDPIIIKDILAIGNQLFFFEKEDSYYFITHPKWSLVGMGKNLYEAEIDLLKEAKELLNDMRDLPKETLSQEAFNLLDYLFSVV